MNIRPTCSRGFSRSCSRAGSGVRKSSSCGLSCAGCTWRRDVCSPCDGDSGIKHKLDYTENIHVVESVDGRVLV